MATPRAPLTPKSGNSRRKHNLSPNTRSQLIGAIRIGHSLGEVARSFSLPKSTVQSATCIERSTSKQKDLPCSGMPKVFTDIDYRNILRFVRFTPKATYSAIRTHLAKDISSRTISCFLTSCGISNWRAKRRPFLSNKVAAKRLAWCLAQRGWTIEEWGLIMWSNECSVERGRGKNQEWVFRTPTQKWDREIIQTYKSSRDLSIMVWGAFWDNGRSDLYVLDRDFASKKHGYSANSYLEVLEAQVAPDFEMLDDPGYIFMQDNAPIHTAYKVRDWFLEHGITTLDWPPYSPDLNPIEHIWWVLKKLLEEHYPDLSGKTESDIEEIQEALKVCWELIPKETFDTLWESMPSRIEACIKANGWHTKY